MKDKKPPEELPPATPSEIDLAGQFVNELLGEEFGLEYGGLPRNVGVQGDQGVRGDTVMVTSESVDPAKTFTDRYDQLGQLVTRFVGQTPTTKVLIDITPADANPTFISDKPKESVPFIEKVRSKILGYPDLYKKYYDQLDDPMMQTAIWNIMNVRDMRIRASVANQMIDYYSRQKR